MHAPFTSRWRRPLLLGIASVPLALASTAHAADRSRAYELVSFPDAGVSMMAGAPELSVLDQPDNVAADGSVLLASQYAVPGQTAASNFNFWSVHRTPAGWQSEYVGVPARRTAFDPSETFLGLAPDFKSSLWTSANGVPDPTDPSDLIRPTVAGQFGGGATSVLRRSPDGGVHEQAQGPAPFQSGETLSDVGRVSDDGTTAFFHLIGGALLADASQGDGVYRRTGSQTVDLVSRDSSGTALDLTQLYAASGDGRRALVSGRSSVTNTYVTALWHGSASTTVLGSGAESPLPVAVDHQLNHILLLTRLSLDAADTDTSADLYRYDVSAGTFTLLTKGTTTGGDTSDPATCVAPLSSSQLTPIGDCDAAYVASNADQSIVYFASPEILDGAPGAGAGETNLYRSGPDGLRFVTKLAASGPFEPDAVNRGAFNVEANGSLTFESKITGDPSADTGGQVQVQRYDAATRVVRCLSCRRDGGPTQHEARSRSLLGTGRAGRNVTADGRYVYFTTAEALAPEDINSVNDVYESDTATGSVRLVSPGSAEQDSSLTGVSPDGTDVFFLTRETLVPQDHNGGVKKLYDARIGGGFSRPATAAPCDGDACRPAAAAPPPTGPVATTGVPEVTVAVADGDDVTAKTPSASALRKFVRTGRLAIKLSGLDVGNRLRVRLVVAGKVIVRADFTAKHRDQTITLRLSRSARLSLAKRLAKAGKSARISVESLAPTSSTDATVSLPKTKTGGSK
jgi:hypothetical protein